LIIGKTIILLGGVRGRRWDNGPGDSWIRRDEVVEVRPALISTYVLVRDRDVSTYVQVRDRDVDGYLTNIKNTTQTTKYAS
jgi:hypothetical protein